MLLNGLMKPARAVSLNIEGVQKFKMGRTYLGLPMHAVL